MVDLKLQKKKGGGTLNVHALTKRGFTFKGWSLYEEIMTPIYEEDQNVQKLKCRKTMKQENWSKKKKMLVRMSGILFWFLKKISSFLICQKLLSV